MSPVSLEKQPPQHHSSEKLKEVDKVSQALDRIESTEERIDKELGLEPGSPESVDLAGQALAEAAKHDIDTGSSDEEVSTEAAVIAGALEATGDRLRTEHNPIHILEVDGYGASLDQIVENLNKLHAKLPNGLEAAQVAAKEIDDFNIAHGLTGDIQVLRHETSAIEKHKTDNAAWNKISRMTEGASPYYQYNHAKISRVPMSLPMSDKSEYDSHAIQYASGDKLSDALEMYGIDVQTAQDIIDVDGKVEASKLPPELQHTLLTAQIYESMARSKDPEIKKQATERNSHVTVEDIWDSKTLHHVMRSDNLASVLENGHLGVMLSDTGDRVVNNGGANSYNVNFGRPIKDIDPDTSHREKINNLSYNDRGDVYIHYARPEGSYREGEEYEDNDLIMLVPGGLPSTEISAFTLRRQSEGDKPSEAYIKTHDAVVESGFYIPIFDVDGNLVYSIDDYKRDVDAKEEGTYLSLGEQQRVAMEKAQQEAWRKHQEEIEQAAAEKGMSKDEYLAWKSAQPVVRPDM